MKIYSRVLIAMLFIPLLCSAGERPQYMEMLSIKAGQGETNAQFLMGTLYLTGRYGVEKDVEKGKYYLLIAAGKGDSDAKRFLALQYYNEKNCFSFLRLFSEYCGGVIGKHPE
ncbi:sel1 repeat family protein [Morganella morganii]|uniref:sel1 repeat family protein n=1 Tax=Morganella morganii TaxID=582 RepID=UPI000D1E2DA6|nr:sel1 repeat family protein [Morganella morganii]QXO42435.1 sel1 repeat family protein [Morganella morganii]QXO46067.1 sel1 repeat family protein [Morganella morganii]QXO49745.1 sel1 repeat family protein [Morganella morganii]QXO53604.1 sel1 repeat family protein [Morganella morganii]QXO61263.1 sel1 repeat family protein [Morganella morganii]